MRSAILRGALVAVLLLLLFPAAVYLTSPWWATAAGGWAARRLWRADLQLATASLNPFALSLEGAGGSFQWPPGKGYQASGELSRLKVEVDLLPLVGSRRIKSLTLELSSLAVSVSDRELFRRSMSMAPGARPLAVPAALPVAEGRPWVIEHLRVRIDHGILRYSEGGRRGEVSMDLNFNASYSQVDDVGQLARKVLEDLLNKAAYGFLTQRLFSQ